MFFLSLLLVQTPTPYELSRLKMEESIQKQRESVRRQAQSIHLYDTESNTIFFSNPWPRPPAPPEMAMIEPVCDPVPNSALTPLVASAAEKNGLSDQLIQTVIRKESAGYPCALSTAGAMGLMQLMPETAETLGVTDPWNPKQNIDAGAQFLKSMLERYGGDLSLALAAYNAGPKNVDRYGGVPPFPETRNYVQGILKILTPPIIESQTVPISPIE